jgi:hypothetical protein
MVTMKVTEKDGRTKHINNHQATSYVPSVEAFEDRHWEGILVTVGGSVASRYRLGRAPTLIWRRLKLRRTT